MKNFVLKSKIWLIATLLIVCVGVIFLSVFGFNNTTDYSKGYELTVGLDQQDDDINKVYETAETYFDEIGVKPLSYSKVYINDGNSAVYKFKDLTGFDKDELVGRIDAVVDNDYVDVIVSTKVVEAKASFDALNIILSLVISAIVLFLFLLIFVKFKMALTNLFASIVSVIAYISMVALFRIPVLNTLGIFVALTFAISTFISGLALIKFNATKKLSDNEKLSALEIVKINAKEYSVFNCIALVVLMLVALVLLVLGVGYLRFIALNIIVATISSVVMNYIAVPTIWSFIDKSGKNN